MGQLQAMHSSMSIIHYMPCTISPHQTPIHLAKTSSLCINLDLNRSFGLAIPWLPCPPIQHPPTTPTRPPLLEHRRHPLQQLPLLPSHLHLQLQHPLLPHPPTQQPTHIRHIPC